MCFRESLIYYFNLKNEWNIAHLDKNNYEKNIMYTFQS